MDPEAIYAALLEPDGVADPYPLYAALHEHGPVVAAGPELVLVPGYEAVGDVLRDPEFQVDDEAVFDACYPDWREHPAVSALSLLSLNGADHARIRGPLARRFTHRRAQSLAPVIDSSTDRLLDELADRGAGGGPVDVLRDFAFALPAAVFCDLAGVSDWDVHELGRLIRCLTAVLEPEIEEEEVAAGDAAAVALADMFTAVIADRRARPGDDLISELVAAVDAPDPRLSESELVQNLIPLLLASLECTTNLLGNGLAIVLASPATGAGLAAGSIEAGAFVEEVLRFDAPVQDTGRRRLRPGELYGVPVTSDDEVVLLLGAANRDPRRFADPDEFRPGRTDGGALSFGGGAHFCLGAALARMEAVAAFPRLLRRFPELAAAGEPRRRPGITFRGYEHIPVRL